MPTLKLPSPVSRLVSSLLSPVSCLLSHVTGVMAQNAPPNVVKELAPNGKLRAAINFGNIVLAQKDPAGGEPRGVSAELARELAKRLGESEFSALYHEGHGQHILMSALHHECLLVTIFGEKTNIGLVRFYAQQVTSTSGSAPNFAPNPPPTSGVMTCSFSDGIFNTPHSTSRTA